MTAILAMAMQCEAMHGHAGRGKARIRWLISPGMAGTNDDRTQNRIGTSGACRRHRIGLRQAGALGNVGARAHGNDAMKGMKRMFDAILVILGLRYRGPNYLWHLHPDGEGKFKPGLRYLAFQFAEQRK